MKKILGIMAMVLLLGGPVFAQDSSVTFTVEVGGNNQAAAYENAVAPPLPAFDTTNATTGTLDLGANVQDVTWDVRAQVGGTVSYGSILGACSGVANVVFTLELYKDDASVPGNLVTGCGAATMACTTGGPIGDISCKTALPTTAGWYSSINDGDADGNRGLAGADAQHLAAFAYAITLPGSPPVNVGRIDQAPSAGGPGMTRAQYPSSYGGATIPSPNPVPVTNATAAQGKLVGMGAGYESFTGHGNDPVNTYTASDKYAGVGAISGSTSCAILGNGPIAEGQISLRGLAGGTYVLKVVPGTGNNVLSFFDPTDQNTGNCGGGTTGRFASAPATAAGVANGGIVKFIYTPPNDGGIQVNISPPDAVTAGAQWSLNGEAGPWNNSGATVTLPTGNYTVHFKTVLGYNAPPDYPTSVTAPNVTVVSGTPATYTPPAPTMTAAATTRRHGNGTTIPFVFYSIPLAISPTGGNTTVEPRNGGPQQIDITYSANIAGTPVVTASAGTVGTPTMAGAVLSIPLTGVADKTCLTVTVNGVTAVGGTASGTQTVKVLGLRGDTSNDHVCGATDIVQVKARVSLNPVTSTTFKYDINCNGTVDATDVVQTKAGSSLTNWPCLVP